MKFEVYCDESRPDLFFNENKTAQQFLMIGSLWLPIVAPLAIRLQCPVWTLRECMEKLGIGR